MGRVLLLEDHQAFRDQFERVFGDRLDHCYNVGEMAAKAGELSRANQSWDYAFVDFELSDRYTGFGALYELANNSEDTRVVVFTALGERGRTLFALAAREWFNVWAVLDKNAATDATLRNVGAGVNPSPDWEERVLPHSRVVNTLFRKPSWLQIWHLWVVYGGTRRAICQAGNGLTLNGVREFGQDASSAVEAVKAAVPLIDIRAAVGKKLAAAPHQAGKTPQAVPISEFYHAHSNFFNAPELPLILEDAQPWKR